MTRKIPPARQKNVTGAAKGVYRRGEALNTGPVGAADGYAGRTGRRSGAGGSGTRASGKGGGIRLILLLAVLLLGGGGGLSALLGGFLGGETTDGAPGTAPGWLTGLPGSGQSITQGAELSTLFTGGSVSTGWDAADNTARLDATVADGARPKRTVIHGDGSDTVTLMVYLCGTDLESRSAMATADLQEMLDAELSDRVNLLVYTGGCRSWRNDLLSADTNQIWQVRDDGLVCLEKDLGGAPMTDPDTLAFFIRWCVEHFPANRNALILWDHGGGSISGYGYDEKYASAGAMDLAELGRALTDGGVTFDFVGFDACLMATAENALMLTQHADYLIASEETEPGIGWNYTRWLTALSQDPALPTLELGRILVDDFTDTCAEKCPGQPTTLSVIDLAELEHTVPAALTAFSAATCELIRSEQYAVVSNARSDTREFASSTRIDQVDLVHLASNLDTAEGDALAAALLGAVKYNRTSADMTNAYGISIYFPFQKVSGVDAAVDTYEQMGMDAEYVRCIQEFAGLEASGQAISGSSSPLPSLLGMLEASSGGDTGAAAIAELLSEVLSGGGITGLLPADSGFLSGRSLTVEDTAAYLAANRFDGSALVWQDGLIDLPEEQWALVQSLHTNLFYDDGEGFLDLGLDTAYSFREDGALLAPAECTWLAIDGQPVAYYHESTTVEDGGYTITGRVPVMHNGVRGELVLCFTDEEPTGSVLGVRTVYTGETDTLAKGLTPLAEGDTLDLLCDYYGYDGGYRNSYMLGEPLVVRGEPVISDVVLDADAARLTCRFTDIYNQEYWSEPAPIG